MLINVNGARPLYPYPSNRATRFFINENKTRHLGKYQVFMFINVKRDQKLIAVPAGHI